MKIGDIVFVKDDCISKPYHFQPAKVIVVQKEQVLLKFKNGKREYFWYGNLKSENKLN